MEWSRGIVHRLVKIVQLHTRRSDNTPEPRGQGRRGKSLNGHENENIKRDTGRNEILDRGRRALRIIRKRDNT